MEGAEELTAPSDENNEIASNDNAEGWFGRYADSLCPYYVSLGVPMNEYWHGDYSLFKFYVEADKLKKSHENYTAWLQGAYFYDSLCAVSPILHAFAKKGTKPAEYHKKPYPLPWEQENTPKQEESKAVEMKCKFMNMAKMWNENFKGKEGGDNG